MKIYARTSDIEKQRQKYVEEYNAKKSRYDDQTHQYDLAYADYADRICNRLKHVFKNEIDQFPHPERVHFEVKDSYRVSDMRSGYSTDPGKNSAIRISYIDPKFTVNEYDKKHRDTGFSWTFTVMFGSIYQGNQWVPSLIKDPTIDARHIDIADISAIQATYNFFAKIEEFDWEALLNEILADIPKKQEYVTEEHPGVLDTSEFDKQIKNNVLESIVGKDVWVKVEYRKTGNTKWPQTGFCMLKRDPGTAYYSGYLALSYWGGSRGFDKHDYDRLRLTSLRKNGLKIVEPMETFTTAELFNLGEGN